MTSPDETTIHGAHFVVLRRWNSFGPTLPAAETGPGGGYLVIWGGNNLAVDPGFDFLKNMQETTLDHHLTGVILTHSHIDHSHDFELILMTKYERTDALKSLAAYEKSEETRLDLFMSLDSFVKFGPVVTSQQPHVADWAAVKVLHPGAEYTLQARDGGNRHLGIQALFASHGRQRKNDESDDLVSRGVGLKIRFYEGDELVKTILLTGDTRYDEGFVKQTEKELLDADIVVAHVGTVDIGELLGMAEMGSMPRLNRILEQIQEAPETVVKTEDWLALKMLFNKEPTTKNSEVVTAVASALMGYAPENTRGHLWFRGTAKVMIKAFTEGRAHLGIISEFGLELGPYRHQIADSIAHSIFGPSMKQGSKRILTGDVKLALRFASDVSLCDRLPEKCCKRNKVEYGTAIMCTRCNSFVPIGCINEETIRHRGNLMVYNCIQCHSREYSPFADVVSFS